MKTLAFEFKGNDARWVIKNIWAKLKSRKINCEIVAYLKTLKLHLYGCLLFIT